MSEACCATCDRPAAPAPRRGVTVAAIAPVVLSGSLIVAGALLAGGNLTGAAIAAYAAAALLCLPTPLRRAGRSIAARRLDINVLMVIAVAGAAALGDWFEAATVVWLFAIAQRLESWSMDRARHAIRALMTLAPARAVVRRDGRDQPVDAAEVVAGDVVIVRPGERIPVDGRVIAGVSAVDQAPVTGESWPAEKGPGDDVFAGTVNGTGALEIGATRPAADSTIARIIHLVEHAQSARAPVQRFVDRFAARYTPAVVLLALAVAVVMPFASAGAAGWSAAFPVWGYRALTLLVVACPCALVISTPVSVVAALTAAARAGVLVKGGAHLEALGQVRCVVFDKTGTLTDARVSIAEITPVNGHSPDGVLAVAASLEARSEHPIGRAIVDRATAAGLDVVPGEGFRALPGLGAEATVDAAPAVVGSHRLFEERALCTPALHAEVQGIEGRGGSAVLVSHAGEPLGVIAFSDSIRDEGRHIVDDLRREGIRHIALVTGDRAPSAAAIRTDAGLDEAHGDLLPEDKVAHVKRLRDLHGPVAMVGDGVNDAPALAAADVGIAMGAVGTDVALESADVALLADDLAKLPYAVRLGRETIGNIRANVAIALGLKLAFVGLAIGGVATLWMAVLADTGASLFVTANSLRLLRVR